MRAARWYGPHDVRVVELEDPRPGEGEVLLTVAYCGICGSDLHEYADGPHAIPMRSPHPLSGRTAPLTLGHEFSATVAEAGAGVHGLEPGAPVAIEPNYRCGRCARCAEGRYNICTGFGFAGLMGDGGLAEYASVPAYMVHPLPAGTDLAAAALLEPAAVARHAVRRSTLREGEDCAVVGLGPVGLLLGRLAALAGARHVVGVEPARARREAAAAMGFTEVRADPPSDRFPVVFEAVGSQQAFDTALAATDSGGECVLLGLADRLVLPAFDAVNAEQRITTSVGYAGVHGELIGMLAEGALDPSPLISEVRPLESVVTDGFERLARSAEAIKILIRPGEGS